MASWKGSGGVSESLSVSAPLMLHSTHQFSKARYTANSTHLPTPSSHQIIKCLPSGNLSKYLQGNSFICLLCKDQLKSIQNNSISPSAKSLDQNKQGSSPVSSSSTTPLSPKSPLPHCSLCVGLMDALDTYHPHSLFPHLFLSVKISLKQEPVLVWFMVYDLFFF